MKIFDVASGDQGGRPLFQVQHPNFVDIYEIYVFEDVASVFTEYIGFSIEDLLLRSIYPTEREIAYIISQLIHPCISIDNIFISSKGEVKIDPTEMPADKEYISADSKSLSTIMLQMMNEKRESLEASPKGWSAEAVHFVEATASATPEELSDVSLPTLYSCSLLRPASISS
ncbi:hypothetical protein BKA61DRAFT_622623 [Leptodontidium sp. MPI-SDFR-AT-0119]|nr:hypothetical protein BKA61DRAFT_622623 [Leptodontidium sp. MPI-SDFR-AT-0119]